MRVVPKLDVRDLDVVLALAAAGTTTKAAGKLHLTQSAVSRALAVAEGKLGTRLFERTRDGLAPTAAGRRLLEGAGPILAQLADLERDVKGDTARTRLRIVCECYTAYRWLPSTLAALRPKLPRLELVLAVEHTRAPVEALRAGHVDVALLTTAPVSEAKRSGLVERALFTDEVSFVVALTHPLARKRTITPDDLVEHGIVTNEAPPAEVLWFANAVFGRKRPKVRMTTFPLTEAVFDAARAGMGVAVASEWIASTYLEHGDLVAKRLARGPLLRPWRIAWRSEVHEAAALVATALAPRSRLVASEHQKR
jgi:LysR family transcriptional regulator, regulator for metE and metH